MDVPHRPLAKAIGFISRISAFLGCNGVACQYWFLALETVRRKEKMKKLPDSSVVRELAVTRSFP